MSTHFGPVVHTWIDLRKPTLLFAEKGETPPATFLEKQMILRNNTTVSALSLTTFHYAMRRSTFVRDRLVFLIVDKQQGED
jgi:hypothetical protein